MIRREPTVLVNVTSILILVLSACGPSADAPLRTTGARAKADSAAGQLALTGSFDGSQGFTMWLDTVDLAREVARDHGKPVGFSFFVNGVHYYVCQGQPGGPCEPFPPQPDDDGDGQPDVQIDWPPNRFPAARSREEVIARLALTQQAINEGHDVGSHSMYHESGGEWGVAQWEADFAAMASVLGASLFEPVPDDTRASGFAFPRWIARSEVPGTLGAACDPQAPASCAGDGLCITLAANQSFCSQPCNRDRPCPAGFACGGDGWSGGLYDRCVPLPEFPVIKDGETLFFADGTPSAAAVASGSLRRYRMVGARAPFLATSPAMYEVMRARGYRYDASAPTALGPPTPFWIGGELSDLWRFGVMSARPSGVANLDWPMPFDSVYAEFGLDTETMRRQYRDSIQRIYQARDQIGAWNINGHFSFWLADETGRRYWDVFTETIRWAAAGCPDEQSAVSCPELNLPSFARLADRLDAETD